MAKEKDTVETQVDERQVRWEAFLVEARKVNPVRFDAQKANKEFDTIPESFQ